MLLEELLFGIAYVIAAAAPLLRFRIGIAPVYWMDIFIILSLVMLLIRNRRLALPRSSTPVFLSIIFLICTAVLMWVYTGDYQLYFYANGRRILPMLGFFIACNICLGRPGGKDFLKRVMVFGLTLHAGLIVLQYLLSLVNYQWLRAADDFFYLTLCSTLSPSRTIYWTVDWYVPRAFGGYWNSNAAVPALFIPLAFCFFLPYSRNDLVKMGLVAVAALLTGSKQSLVAIVFLVLFNLTYLRHSASYLKDWFRITILGVFVVAVISMIPFRGLDRPDEEAPDKQTALESSIVSRLNNYPGFVTTFFSSDPHLILFGKGVDYTNISAHSKQEKIEKLNVGFVSNSWLIPLIQQGLVGFLCQVWVYFSWLKNGRSSPKYISALLIFTIIAICDNHIATLNSLQLIYFTIGGIIAAAAVQEQTKVRQYEKPKLLLEPLFRKKHPAPRPAPVPPARNPYSPPVFFPLVPQISGKTAAATPPALLFPHTGRPPQLPSAPVKRLHPVDPLPPRPRQPRPASAGGSPGPQPTKTPAEKPVALRRPLAGPRLVPRSQMPPLSGFFVLRNGNGRRQP